MYVPAADADLNYDLPSGRAAHISFGALCLRVTAIGPPPARHVPMSGSAPLSCTYIYSPDGFEKRL